MSWLNYVKINYNSVCYHVYYRTPFCGGSEERTKENILSYSYRPMYDYEIFSFAGEMFIDSCLRYFSLITYSINKTSLHMHLDTWWHFNNFLEWNCMIHRCALDSLCESVHPLAVSEHVHNSCSTWYILYQILHTYACHHCQTTRMHNSHFGR